MVCWTQSCPNLCDPMDCSPPWTVSLSMEFSKQEHWSGLPFPSPGDLPNPGIKHSSPALQTNSLPTEPPGKQLKFMVESCSMEYPAALERMNIHSRRRSEMP